MISITKEEKQLRVFLAISAIVYFVVGIIFLVLPDQVLAMMNRLSRGLGLPSAFPSTERFWLSLAFSMMMTIATLCAIAQYNIRCNKGYVFPVLVSKCASSLSGLGFFVFTTRYFAYLAIFVVDGGIFWLTLWLYLRAYRAFFQAQTFILRQVPTVPAVTPATTVVALSGEDKFALLDRVLEQTKFFELLETHLARSGKSREEFSVVIKPNFMYMHSKRDISTYTDPQLVEHLVARIAEKGFPNIALVEAQSTLGNYYANRRVLQVAEYIGYSTKKNYRLVDLTEEMVPYNYGGRLGQHFVGPTWRDADFRISFAKNKTHVFCHYTLTLKNIYGTLPMQNKLKEYHARREYDWPTIETLKHFPVHFGLIDGIYSADGQFGVIVDPTPRHTKTIIGGENLIAVDWVGAKKMGLDPDALRVGRFLPLAIEAFGRPERIDWVGDTSVYSPWENVSEVFIQSLDVIEEVYAFSDWWFSGLTAMDEYFTFKPRAFPIRVMRFILRPWKRLFYRHDYLG